MYRADPERIIHHHFQVNQSSINQTSPLYKFITTGILNNEKVYFSKDPYADNTVLEGLFNDHPELQEFIDNGQLVLINNTEIYFKDGNFDPKYIFKSVSKIKDQAIYEGYTGIRLTGFSPNFNEFPEIVDEYLELEENLTQYLQELDISTLCMYEEISYPEEILKRAMLAHPITYTDSRYYLINPIGDFDRYTLDEIICQFQGGKIFDSTLEEMISSSPGKNLIILLEDDPEMQDLYRRIFQHLGLDLITTSKGEEIIDLFVHMFNEGYLPDLIIMDQNIIDGLNGDETISYLNKLGNPVPIILCSGDLSSDVFKNYREYGFVSSIGKPFSIFEINSCLNKYLHEYKVSNITR